MTEPLTDEYLQELRELAEKAAPGGWAAARVAVPRLLEEIERLKYELTRLCETNAIVHDALQTADSDAKATVQREMAELRAENTRLQELFDESQADVLAAVKMCHELTEEGITLDRADELAENWIARGAGIHSGETKA